MTPAGNIYLGGSVTTVLPCDANYGNHDPLLVKVSPAGDILWTRQLAIDDTSDYVFSVAVDNLGNAYLAGSTDGFVGVDRFINGILIKYDSAGNHMWTHHLGTSEFDRIRFVALHAFGGIYIMGSTQGSLGGPHLGSSDIFVAKLIEVPEPSTRWLLVMAVAIVGLRPSECCLSSNHSGG